jgi:putative transposase
MEQNVLSVSNIARVLGVHKATIARRAEKESWPFIETNGRGGKIKKFILYGLPMEIQLLYNKELQGTCHETNDNGELALLPAISEANITGAADVLQASAAPPPIVIMPGLTTKQSTIAAARYDLVTQYVKEKEKTRKKKEPISAVSTDFSKFYNSGIPYKHLFSILGPVAPKTLEKWRHTLHINNMQMDAVAPRHGDHRRGHRVVTEIEMNHLLLHALHPSRRRISECIRWAKKSIEKEGHYSPSSPATMRRWLLDYQNTHYDRWIFCREGEKALEDKVLPYLERDDAHIEVGDVLVADGHKLNFHVRNPYNGKEVRATLLVFFDWKSRYPAGWHIMMQENIQCVHAALRRAILNLGKIPRMVMLDNGKAFKARIFTGETRNIDLEESGIDGLYKRLGIQTYFAKPYNAKAKPIERWFGTFNELERILPSYTGNSIEDKPAHMHRNEKLHKRLHNPWVPDVEQADAIIASWAYGEYATRPHRGLKGLAPADVWNVGKGPGINPESLRFLMMATTVKKVNRNGITLFGTHFFDESLYGYKQPVIVRHDILDLSEVYIYSEDDTEFICTARPVRGVHPVARISDNPLDLQAVKEGLKMQKTLKRDTETFARARATGKLPWEFPESTVTCNELPMTAAQSAEIEAQAAKTKVIFMDEKKEEIPTCDSDVYERLLQKKAAGDQLAAGEISWMKDFEATPLYKSIAPYFHEFEKRLAEGKQ